MDRGIETEISVLCEIRDLLEQINTRGIERERLQDERWAQLDREAAEERELLAAAEERARDAKPKG